MTGTPLKVRIVALGHHFDRGESRRQRRLVFTRWGSDLMRSHQLKMLIDPHLPPHVDLAVSTVPSLAFQWMTPWILAQPKAVFILLKNVAYAMTPAQTDLLRSRAIGIGIDHVDGDFRKIDLARYDFHIAASHAGLAALGRACAGLSTKAQLLLHHADPRLDDLTFGPLPKVAAVYLGLVRNISLPKALSSAVEIIRVGTPDEMVRAMPQLPAFNLHYCVRPIVPARNDQRVYKPFTKGLTAAACRSNIIVNRDVDDAVAVLGDDYPYLVDNLEDDSIAAVLDRARVDFGTPRWSEALARMAQIRTSVSGPSLARQFIDILNTVG